MLKYLSIFKDVLKLYSYVGNTSFNGLLNDFKGFIVSIKCVILFSVNIIWQISAFPPHHLEYYHQNLEYIS